jgi:hypothetical protein
VTGSQVFQHGSLTARFTTDGPVIRGQISVGGRGKKSRLLWGGAHKSIDASRESARTFLRFGDIEGSAWMIDALAPVVRS